MERQLAWLTKEERKKIPITIQPTTTITTTAVYVLRVLRGQNKQTIVKIKIFIYFTLSTKTTRHILQST